MGLKIRRHNIHFHLLPMLGLKKWRIGIGGEISLLFVTIEIVYSPGRAEYLQWEEVGTLEIEQSDQFNRSIDIIVDELGSDFINTLGKSLSEDQNIQISINNCYVFRWPEKKLDPNYSSTIITFDESGKAL